MKIRNGANTDQKPSEHCERQRTSFMHFYNVEIDRMEPHNNGKTDWKRKLLTTATMESMNQ